MKPSGWNYNLTRRCVKTTVPSGPNYFEFTYDCPPSPVPGIPSKHWTLAVSSENGVSGVVCPQPEDQSFPFNAPGSPVSIGFLPHTDENGIANWAVNLKTNLHDITHPCGVNHFTWSMWMDHGQSAGPLPPPTRTHFSATVNYNDFAPNGAVRGIALYQGFWAGKTRLIELAFQSSHWGDNIPGSPGVVDYRNTDSLTYIALDGPYYGIEAPRLQDTVIEINWSAIIGLMAADDYFPDPDAQATTVAIGIGHEVHNWTPSLAAVADLWFTNFRASEL